jgi:hypothetical protein
MQKTKTMNTIIGINHQALKIAQAKNNVAEQCYLQAVALISEFCPITDEALFRSNFTAYVRAFIKKDKYLSLIDVSSVVNLKTLEVLDQRYREYKVDTDPKNFNYIITKLEQQTALDYATALSKLLNEHPKITELKHQLRNSDIPLLSNTSEGFSVNLEAICLL